MRIVTVFLAAFALVTLTSNTVVAQADPDAKGTITCNAGVVAGTSTIDVNGTRTAVAG